MKKYVKLYEEFTILNEKAVTINPQLKEEIHTLLESDLGSAAYYNIVEIASNIFKDALQSTIRKYYPTVNVILKTKHLPTAAASMSNLNSELYINMQKNRELVSSYSQWVHRMLDSIEHELTHYINNGIRREGNMTSNQRSNFTESDLKNEDPTAWKNYIFTNEEILAYATNIANEYNTKYGDGAIDVIKSKGLCGNVDFKVLEYYCKYKDSIFNPKESRKFINKLTKNVVSLLQGNEYEYTEYTLPGITNCKAFGKMTKNSNGITVDGDLIITTIGEPRSFYETTGGLFNTIRGNLYLYGLTYNSLYGLPERIEGSLYMNCLLDDDSPEYFPKYIGGDIHIGESLSQILDKEDFERNYIPKDFKGKIIFAS